LDRIIERLSVARWTSWNAGCKKRFAIDYDGCAAVSDQIFSVQVAAAEQTHQRETLADAAVEACQLLIAISVAMRHKLNPPVLATINHLWYANTQRRSVLLGELGHEAAQDEIDPQWARLVHDAPTVTAQERHG
jgi:hypothetical protein